MKQKATRLLLFLLVGVVWGAVIVRAFKRPDPVMDLPSLAEPIAVETSHAAPHAGPLLVLDRDPFLDGTAAAQRTAVRPISTTTTRDPKPKAAVADPVRAKPWPSIKYTGMMRAKAGTASTVFLTINGRSQILREGAVSDGLRVISASADSVTVERDGVRKTVGRE